MLSLISMLGTVILLLLFHLSVTQASSLGGSREPVARDTPKASIFASERKACNFYVWNIVSAGLHGVCCHLSKDCTYEGRGGRRVSLIGFP